MGSLEETFKQLRRPLLAYACNFVGDYQDAQEVVQEVFIECHSKQKNTDRAYLFAAVRNRSLNKIRTHQRFQRMLGDFRCHLSNALPSLDFGEVTIDEALARLPDRQREVISLRIKNELKISEIAVVLDLPEGTVKSRINSAVKALRKIMET